MSWHRTVVTLLLVVTTILALLYVSMFEPETLSDPVLIPLRDARCRAEQACLHSPGDRCWGEKRGADGLHAPHRIT